MKLKALCSKTISFVKTEYVKFLLCIVFTAICYTFDQMEFPRIEVFIRDSLQYLNSPNEVNKSIVTVNLDLGRPLTTKKLIDSIEKFVQLKAQNIVLLIKPDEIVGSSEEKIVLLNYFRQIKNLYLYDPDNNTFGLGFSSDPIFKNYERFFKLTLTGDEQDATPENYKHRRAILFYSENKKDSLPTTLNKMGIQTVPIDHFQYSFNYWNTTQAYIKTYKVGVFGHISFKKILSASEYEFDFTNKTVLLGLHDEYSFLSRPSIFNFFMTKQGDNFSTYMYPFQESVANLMNLYTTGNYIKFLQNFKFIYLFLLLFCVVTYSRHSHIKKVIFFLTLGPISVGALILTYYFTSFYFDISKTLAAIAITQYLLFPIYLFWYNRIQEKIKLNIANNARIDALLFISEKIAHDIRSPISAIRLLMTKAIFETQEQASIVNSSLMRIDQIAQNILEKHKMEHNFTDTQNLIPQKIEIAIQDLIKEKQAIFNEIKFKFTPKNLGPHGPSYIGDESQVIRIISNLLDNSVQSLNNKANAKINVLAIASQEFFKIEVQDNGVGIEPNILKLLGINAVTTKAGSKGNGIAILHAKRIVEQFGGNLTIKSIPNEGTVVYIILKPSTNKVD